MYAHGLKQRIQAVGEHHGHVAVTSAAAVRAELEAAGDLRIAAQLPIGTYYATDSVVVMARTPHAELPPPERLRVGIDRLSADHTWLTEAEFPSATYLNVSYAQLPTALRQGTVDAAVWHRTALGLSLDDQALITWDLTPAPGPADHRRAVRRRAHHPRRRRVGPGRGGRARPGPPALAVQRDVVLGEVLPLY
jgi:hypothetical protein